MNQKPDQYSREMDGYGERDSRYKLLNLDKQLNDKDDDLYLDLDAKCVSQSSIQAIYDLISLIRSREGWKYKVGEKTQRAFIGLVHGLLGHASRMDETRLYRSLQKESFKGAYVGYDPFIRVFNAFKNAGFIDVWPGYNNRDKDSCGASYATRLRATPVLFEFLIRYAITPSNYGDHFRPIVIFPDTVPDPVRVRESKGGDWKYPERGRLLPLDLTDPRVQPLIDRVNRLHSFYAKQDFQGCIFKGLYRLFNQGELATFAFNKGGRFYVIGDYQKKSQKERTAIRINGEAVAEVDVSASHLTIAHVMLDMPILAAGDLYAVPGIEVRDVVKMFVTVTLGMGKLAPHWPKDSKVRYLRKTLGIDNRADKVTGRKARKYTKEELGRLQQDYPIGKVREAVSNHLPILKRWEASGLTWADLQYRESLGLIATVEELAYKYGIAALPLHDSVIVPVSKVELVEKVMEEAFFKYAGVRIRVTVK